MAVQVRPVNDSSMLSQQLPEQIRKASLIELTTMKEKNNNNSINSVDTDQNKSFTSILSFNEQAKEKHMHLESEINGKGKQQQQELEHEHDDYEVEEEGDEAQRIEFGSVPGANHLTDQNGIHSLTDAEAVQEYFPSNFPHLLNHKLRSSGNSKSTESLQLRSNQVPGSITPPHHQMGHLTESHSQSPLDHYSINNNIRLPKIQGPKKSLVNNASGTNLNVYLRGNRRHSLTSAPITELLTSPKLKKATTSGLLDSRYGNKSNNKNGHIPNTASPLAEKKNRLVDQFYNSSRVTSPNSRADLPSLLKDHHQLSKSPSMQQISAPLTTPVVERRVLNWKEESLEPKETMDLHTFNNGSFLLSDEVVDHMLNNGGFGFNYDHNQIIEDDELLNYLLNIDNIIDHRTDGSTNSTKAFDQLSQIMANISDKSLTRARTVLMPNKRNAPDALKELDRIDLYLQNLQTTTQEMCETLSSNLDRVTDAYKNEIHENVIRLNQVSDELKMLENKSDMFKEKIKEQKSSKMNDMMENLDMLDDINNKLQKFSDVKKQRFVIRINVICGLFILVISIYYAYFGKQK